jgi:outer membrane protein, multidrug efflux system
MMQPLKTTTLALLLATLCGCSSLVPSYLRPASPVPEAFPATPGTAATPASPAAKPTPLTAWQDFFAEPDLKTLIGIALRNNRDLRVALLNVEQASTQVDVRKADRWPTLNAGTSLTRQTTSSGAVTSTYNAGLLVTAYEIDLFDRLRSLSDAALAQYLASSQASRAAQISLVGAVATSYYALQTDAQLLQLAQQTLKTREASLELIALRERQGASSQLDLNAAQSLLEAARVSVAQLSRQRLQDENALALLLGQSVPAQVIDSLNAPTPGPTATLPVGLPSEVLLQRPDVLQAEQQLIAANANIGAARAAYFPRITLTASAGSVSNELDGLFSTGTFAWSVLPQLLVPIFDAGRTAANVKAAEVGRNIATAQYEKAIQSAFREVADALAARATLDTQRSAQQAQTRAEQERARLTSLRYEHGASSYLDVLDAQRALFASQQASLQLEGQYRQSLATLYRVLGGGWSAEATAQP